MSPPNAASGEALPGSPCSLPGQAQQWFHEEVHPHEKALKDYLHVTYPRARDLDDVVQQTYVRLWGARQRDTLFGSVRAVLFTTASRLVIDQLRRLKRSPIDRERTLEKVVLPDQSPGVREQITQNERIQMVIDVLEELPPRCREIMVMVKIRGMSRAEVSATLGLSEKTVDVQVTRGMKRCAESLRRRGVKGAFLDAI